MTGLYDIDSTSFPNFALMKIARHCMNNHEPFDWYLPLEHKRFDRVFVSSVFTFSNKSTVFDDMTTGGSGFDIHSALPPEIEELEPYMLLYPNMTHALGFITRGCIRHCNGCIVPDKEGGVKPYRDIDTIAQGRREIVLMDNNVLASEFGLQQIEKIIDRKYKVDFNQGLDARLITDEIAKLLSRVTWFQPLRMACDNDSMIDIVRTATERLRWHNCKPTAYSVYVMIKDIPSAIKRVKALKGIGLDPFVQPYIDAKGTEPAHELKDFARWVNHKATFKSCTWEDYNK